ncbi:class I SAM-dependent methyltransferase [Mesoterricola silvestris]|uniref:Type 12 methyltransferase n=1 Tax=Mesoterricola silvestris TaxID=2927979 RepID=A0AA48GNT7_9BACT|nr:class I SAM-dependent methyltransferase [Mesoterricola silvestris]BDU71430.1 type 12 methyltransferase [Mesoterricola silvestris]
MNKESHAANLKFWDELADLHVGSSHYNVKAFLESGCTLRSVECEELGDVFGKRLLHLQCHFGLDTLSWAGRGAEVTGVDFSSAAIAIAERLSRQTGLPARFLCLPVEDLDILLDSTFDVIFTSYGVLTWLQALEPWAATISRLLKKGGVFYIVDEHPIAKVFAATGKDHQRFAMGEWQPYWHAPTPTACAFQHSYAEPTIALKNTTQFLWRHPLSEIINSLVSSHLQIEFLHEFPKSFYQVYQDMAIDQEGWWILEKHKESIPLMFSIKAHKQ